MSLCHMSSQKQVYLLPTKYMQTKHFKTLQVEFTTVKIQKLKNSMTFLHN
uniref:Uncharacterized protein n=1 Tax=Setaria italica TaxID=4555 RepID=K3Y0U9_SETIT